MARPLNFPEPFHEGSFRVRDARDAVPGGSLRTLANPYRGVRCHDAPDTVVERFGALRLVCPGDLALSHCSAAEALNLPLPRECEHDAVHVMGPCARIRRRGVVAHRGLDRREVTTLRGIPVTGLADTWLDLAPFVSLEDLVVIGDAVARRLGGTDPLRALLGRRVPGVRRAREALEWIRVGSRSPMETRSRVLFVRAGLPEPELNVDISDPDGGWLATGDLVWREAKVVGEYQGADHFGDYERGDDDIVRRRLVEAAGWTYVDFTKDDYFRRPRRLVLVRRVADELGCALDPGGIRTISERAGLPGRPLRACGG
ncbi:hypothetical protein [Janibacter sp. DB-40]|uniref:hypothetical protein n=1 Tax=Janibacter sp. DB-40 TaxID=3028808 RepID=UPI002404DD64|nr:hypothetical protein [Janibacter sp. DB-40]